MTLLRIAISFILAVFVPAQGWAAISVNTANASVSSNAGSNVLTFSHTVVSGSNTILIVAVGAGRTITFDSPASVLFGSDVLTELPGSLATDSVFDRCTLFYKLNPTVQTANVVATYTDVNNLMGAVAFQVDGVDVGGTPFGTAATNFNTTGTTASVSVNWSSGDVVIAFAATDSEATLTEGGTLIKKVLNVGSDQSYGAQYQAFTSGASTSMTWTINSTNWAVNGVALKPAAGAGPDVTPFYKRRVQ